MITIYCFLSSLRVLVDYVPIGLSKRVDATFDHSSVWPATDPRSVFGMRSEWLHDDVFTGPPARLSIRGNRLRRLLLGDLFVFVCVNRFRSDDPPAWLA
jgi:hypothetical protein